MQNSLRRRLYLAQQLRGMPRAMEPELDAAYACEETDSSERTLVRHGASLRDPSDAPPKRVAVTDNAPEDFVPAENESHSGQSAAGSG